MPIAGIMSLKIFLTAAKTQKFEQKSNYQKSLKHKVHDCLVIESFIQNK